MCEMNKTILQKTVQLCLERYNFFWILNRLLSIWQSWLASLDESSTEIKRVSDFGKHSRLQICSNAGVSVDFTCRQCLYHCFGKNKRILPARRYMLILLFSQWWLSFVIICLLEANYALIISLELGHRCRNFLFLIFGRGRRQNSMH